MKPDIVAADQPIAITIMFIIHIIPTITIITIVAIIAATIVVIVVVDDKVILADNGD